jgi:hypothetical protein
VKGWRWLGLECIWGGIVFARTLAAATPIEWDAPEGCPGTEAVYQELQRALGSERGELGSLSRVRGAIVAEPKGYLLTLEVSDAGHRSLRSIRAERCEDLANAAALAIALAVHAAPGASDAGPGPETLGIIEPSAAGPRTEPVPVGRSSEPDIGKAGVPMTSSWSGAANAVLDVGALPDPQLGIGAMARGRLASFELDVHGLFLPNQARAVGDGESVELGLMAAGLRACFRWLEQGLVAGACLGGEAGRFTARGVGLTPTREAMDVWLAVGPAVMARTAFAGPLQLELLVEPLMPLARKRYSVNATEVVHAPPAIDLRFQVGLIIAVAGGDGAR